MRARASWRHCVLACALAAAGAMSASAATGTNASTAGASGAAPRRGDPLQAPDCRSALAALQAQESAADTAAAAASSSALRPQPAPSAELLAARKRAARSCLASRADPAPPPGRLIRAPIAVAPLADVRPPMSASTHAAPPLRPAPAPERPYAVTSCDPGGCWANDGSRLNRVGPDLWGKHGVCTLQGTLLQCP